MPRGTPKLPPEPDEDEPIPVEPNGAELTLLRERQRIGWEAAQKLWKLILHNIQEGKHD